MKRVCVYLGAHSGNNKLFEQATIKLAQELVSMGLTLVYGGSKLGMMGLLSTTVKELGGKAIGITTTHLLNQEKTSEILDELHVVDSMQERKRMLQHLADGFIVMPGGLGTLEEAIETWNSIKIGESNKKIGFLNVANYFDKLFHFINHCVEHEFMNTHQSTIPIIHSEPFLLLRDLIGRDERN
ncbi:TIGR00730 family Rossman fold protein [Fluoribacter dumoffii]|nr:TIGR00730 family Rossman fold protein [Fluoribacter dumoffii]MCW8386951.1 TIGR00730 family Rossman fold protein [Fluoribacter dumoffii]MCW8417546.1 TIGR00730 family Rossman fold protein [Fluoribacter dumoffii]MCW8454612.1 TIGR00730 family Rossman fold protein [Fluoribacter dumoffii]MCW8461311.1 TIGR00730 family Rossman fold protein [Fluoribacter dumoffii]MCW8484751.1 TIGR00730 family Rossman fold protein [Fluoribacter dumoffii]